VRPEDMDLWGHYSTSHCMQKECRIEYGPLTFPGIQTIKILLSPSLPPG
jgi:hypothetical protein